MRQNAFQLMIDVSFDLNNCINQVNHCLVTTADTLRWSQFLHTLDIAEIGLAIFHWHEILPDMKPAMERLNRG